MLNHDLRYAWLLLVVIGIAAAVPAAAAEPEKAADLPPGDVPPATAVDRLIAAGETEDFPGYDHVIVLDESVTRVDERGVSEVVTTVLYKLLTEKGCRDLAALRFNYDPQSAEVEVVDVTLIRDGQRMTIEDPEVRDLPAPQRAIYWRDRIKVLQLPRLDVGDGVEVTTSRRGFAYALLDNGADATGALARPSHQLSAATAETLHPAVFFATRPSLRTASAPAAVESRNTQHGTASRPSRHEIGEKVRLGGGGDDDRFIPPMPGEYFEIVLFSANVPIVEKRYELHLPAGGRLHSQVYNGALYASTRYTAETSIYSWWGFDFPATPHEPRQPAPSDLVTKVVLATVESWEAKSRWFFDINDGQFDSTPEIDAKVAEVLAGAGVADRSDADKAEALVHWVAQNIRYSGQTMGKGEGFTLHPAMMIFEQRSGVCKDIAGMLVAMMRAADIPTSAAMTMAGSRIDDVPADQFNHCVVARQDGDGWVMYDPTWVPYNNDIWSKLETEQHYLVGSPEGETLSRIAYSPPAESLLKASHRGRLDSDGSLSGTIRFQGAGASDGRLRRLIYGTSARRLQARVEGLMAAIGEGVEVKRVEHHPVDDFSSNMWIEIDYRAPNLALPVAGGLELTSPLMSVLTGDRYLFAAAATEWGEQRESDLFLYYTQLVDAEETIVLPAAFVLVAPPEEQEIDETYASFEASAKVTSGSLLTRVQAEVRRRQIPPDGYPGFVKAMSAARDWADTVLRFEPEGRTQ